MKRYTSKVSRRYGENLQLKGERDAGPKAAFRRKPYPPGARGKGRRRRISEYGLQLAEKQKLRIMYGMSEKQFRRFMTQADKSLAPTAEALVRMLEKRLDNVVYRLGWAESRAQGRQYVTHGHIEVNGRRVNIPSYLVRSGDVIGVRERSKKAKPFADLKPKRLKNAPRPTWLKLDEKALAAKVISEPDLAETEMPVDMGRVIEYYAR